MITPLHGGNGSPGQLRGGLPSPPCKGVEDDSSVKNPEKAQNKEAGAKACFLCCGDGCAKCKNAPDC
eukprot:scaffold166030_cov43-Cyclotella_meneghiniana.AAC.1